ncbi:MAG: DUF3558 family protein [Kutzneria sp.]|nr:DUF3558 family protein [Kutzneria sp.]
MRHRLITVLVGLVFSVTACSAGGGSVSTSSAPPTNAPRGLDALDACALLPAKDSGRIGISGEGHGIALDGAATCDWTRQDGYSVAIRLFPSVGLDDIALSGAKTPTMVNRRRAEKVTTDEAGKCVLYVSVAEHSSVQVEIAPGPGRPAEDTPLACYDALKVAFLADPRLP